MATHRLLVAAAAAFAVVATTCGADPPDSYAAYRQTRVEDVPGSFDWQLQPVDDGFRARIAPDEAYAKVFAAGSRPEAIAVLGRVTNTLDGTTGPPAWIFITPHLCFATAKGDLVSPGRTGDGCTDDNLYVQGVDATTGAPLGGFSAYDLPQGWTPARAGTPVSVTSTTDEGTTRLG